MPRITRDSLMTLEAYAKARPEFRARVLAHAGPYRKAHAADWSTLEDILTEAADFWRERHKPFWVFVG